MTITPSGWRPSCGRCRVDRHDRCIGSADCGCSDASHHPDEMLAGALGGLDGAIAADSGLGDDGSDGGEVYHLDPDDETVIVEMSTRIYAQLREAAQLQERDPGVVLRRALEHYLGCERSGCRHHHDERAGAAGGQARGDGEPLEDRVPEPLEDRVPDVPEVSERGWRGCTMVNPYCPDDLCVLPAGHVGGHTLSTMPDGERTERQFPMLPAGASADDLVAAGWRKRKDARIG